MCEISEEEIMGLCGDRVLEVVSRIENNTTESVVCLKRMHDGFLLGISGETRDCLRLFLFASLPEAQQAYEIHVAKMHETGYPFLD